MLGDPDELKAAVSNLVDNAIKYSNGQVRRERRARRGVDDRRVAVRVRDKGIGISQPELKRIFRRFYRIPEAVAMRIKGTGLGLFIVSSDRAQARRARVRREPGSRPGQHVHAAAPDGAHGMSRILVVEDEQHLADGLRFNLEAEGTTPKWSRPERPRSIAFAPSGDPVDLVVLDVMLPGLNGFEVVSRLRQEGRYLPVLMLTARGRADDVVKGFEAGADDYLPKPFELVGADRARRGAAASRDVGAARRRHRGTPEPPVPDKFSFAGREVDFAALEVRRGERVVPLTLMEANLLRFLVQREGQIVSRKEILEQVWGVHEDTDTRAIDNFIVRLRRYRRRQSRRAEAPADGAQRGLPVRRVALTNWAAVAAGDILAPCSLPIATSARFPPCATTAQALYDEFGSLPLVCPHGHVDPQACSRSTSPSPTRQR